MKMGPPPREAPGGWKSTAAKARPKELVAPVRRRSLASEMEHLSRPGDRWQAYASINKKARAACAEHGLFLDWLSRPFSASLRRRNCC